MKKIYQFILGMVMAVLVAACADDKELEEKYQPTQNGITITVEASMPSEKSVSKVGLSQEDNSLKMITKWQNDDVIQMFIVQDKKCHLIGNSKVKNITSGGKNCSFDFVVPQEINISKEYYVFGFCGIEGTLENGIVTIDTPMKRVPISDFKAPVYFSQKVNSTELKADFMHLGAYEILHVKNTSGNNIVFTLEGYYSDTPWYHTQFHNTYDWTNSSSGVMTYSGTTGNPELKGVAIGHSNDIVSWYAPNGGTIDNAILKANISGNRVKSINKKSSKTIIQRGKAYHLYTVWDGKELKFTNQDGSESDVITNPLIISCTPVTSATVGTTTNVTATANKNCNITLLVNGTTKTTASNKTSLTYDLSQLSPGTYKIKFKAVVGSESVETQEFTCTVKESVPLTITSTAAGVATRGDVTNVTATANKSGKITMFLNGEAYSSVQDQSTMTYDLSQLPVGFYRIKFRVEVGSESAETTEFQCTVSNPTLHVHLAAFVDGNTVSEIDYGTVVEFRAMPDKDCVMDLYIDGKLAHSGSSSVQADTWHSLYSTDKLTAGTHTIKVEVSEQYGNAFDEITINVKSKQSYDYIDLGLPSGTLWATCNVGSGNPWEYGDLLESDEDPVTLKMGSNWRLPTQNEYRELVENCNLQWTTDYNGTGVQGMIITSKKWTTKSIFLPVKGSVGRYWTSTEFNRTSEGGWYRFFQFMDGYTNYNNGQLRTRGYGLYGRAVRN